MNLILFDYNREDFLPLTFTRPVADLRCGIFTFAERWNKIFDATIGFQTESYLEKKFPKIISEDLIFINGAIFPNEELIQKIPNLKLNQAIYWNDVLIAARSNSINEESKFKRKIVDSEVKIFQFPWELFSYNSFALEYDFDLITKNRTSEPIPTSNGIIGNPARIFIESGAKVEFCTLNTNSGSIYLGKNSEIMEGTHVRGGLSLGENSIINMGSKIYGATTIGPFCKIGGEVNNVIFWGFSNKGHEGFIGNSIVGQWCNFGADTNSSNMKNNYAEVKCWSYNQNKFINTGLQFCGTIFGDHSKTAINTQLNTGTVVGIFANIFSSGLPPNLVESFAWGGERNGEKFKINKVFEIAERVMKRRNIDFDQVEQEILNQIFLSECKIIN